MADATRAYQAGNGAETMPTAANVGNADAANGITILVLGTDPDREVGLPSQKLSMTEADTFFSLPMLR